MKTVWYAAAKTSSLLWGLVLVALVTTIGAIYRGIDRLFPEPVGRPFDKGF